MRRIRPHKPDRVLLALVGALLLVGLFTITSASLVQSNEQFGTAYYYLNKQLLYGVGGGLLAFLIGYCVHYTRWRALALPILIVSLIGMALVFAPGIGLELKGARRWLDAGPISVQPAEVLKLGFIMYLAAWIESKRSHISDMKFGFLPFVILLGIISVFFIMQPDVGTLGVLAITSVALFFIGGGKITQIALLLLVGIGLLGWLAYSQPYRMNRILVFLDPSFDTQGVGYQLNQALIAIGSGGVWGRGFGMSRQKFEYLPEATGDSIFAVFAEEFGFLGSTFLLGLFGFLFWRGMRISIRAPDTFAAMLAAGITLLIVIQAMVNIGAISGILPLTGLPLSFVSYGSSALVVHLASIGILANISRYTGV